MRPKGKVFVGMSGGVDSSVAAWRLLKDGYDVVGVFIKVWHPEWLVCNWEAERLDAMRVAAHLGIPFLTCDAVTAYKEGVADYFISEYTAGRTPNPDVMCNREVKFGAFLEFALARGAEYVATGHYAQRRATGDGYHLLRGADPQKDQSYFLWTLTPSQLSRILLPVGDTTKTRLRREAARAGLPTAEKKDSQGICFLGHIDIAEFLSHYTTLVPGDVLNESGTVIGMHRGALIYTLGQRHGFTITAPHTEPYYVVARDIAANTITVAEHPATLPARNEIRIQTVNWIAEPPHPGKRYDVQTRYRQTPFPATLSAASDGSWLLTTTTVTAAPQSGQSAVIYDGERCLGGGIISECPSSS